MGDNRIDILKDEIIANTIKRNTKRQLNLIEIAGKIYELRKLTGSISNVSKLVGISSSTLNKFLSVLKLSSQVKNMIKERDIDSIEIAYALKTLSQEDQNYLAGYVAAGQLNSHDIRAIAPFRKKKLSEDLDSIIKKILSSKNIKIYSAYIDLHHLTSIQKIQNLLYSHFPKKDIHQINLEDSILKISFTANGYNDIKQMAKNKKITLKQFLNTVVNG